MGYTVVCSTMHDCNQKLWKYQFVVYCRRLSFVAGGIVPARGFCRGGLSPEIIAKVFTRWVFCPYSTRRSECLETLLLRTDWAVICRITPQNLVCCNGSLIRSHVVRLPSTWAFRTISLQKLNHETRYTTLGYTNASGIFIYSRYHGEHMKKSMTLNDLQLPFTVIFCRFTALLPYVHTCRAL